MRGSGLFFTWLRAIQSREGLGPLPDRRSKSDPKARSKRRMQKESRRKNRRKK